MKFSTCTIASFGATMRKYATAFTRTGTLSLVITSCGGMLSVIVRRSTLTILSTTGIRKNSPGPFGCASSRPSRKTIPRSYSRATLIAAVRKSRIRKTIAARAMSAPVTGLTLRQGPHVEHQTLASHDLDVLARLERRVAACLPELAVHEDEPAGADDALLAEDRLRTDGHRPPAYLDRLCDRERPEQPEPEGDREHERHGRLVRARRIVEEHQHPDPEADQAGDRQCAVRHDVRVDHEQCDPEQDEDEARPADRQNGEPEERGDEGHRAERAGEHDARVEDLEADPGDAREEEQGDDVRVDQRGEQPREEPGAHVVDLRVGGV